MKSHRRGVFETMMRRYPRGGDGGIGFAEPHLDPVVAVTLYLVKDCCGGCPELGAPLIEELTPCC